MDGIVTLFYILFTFCLICPPSELVSAGFTIPQIFDNVLGSENRNFVDYHMKRIVLTIFIQSFLPVGYVIALWFSGVQSSWLLPAGIITATVPLVAIYKINSWWQRNMKDHPVVVALSHYTTASGDWRIPAGSINREYHSTNKVILPLSVTSKFIAMENWLVKVEQYKLNIIKQQDAVLVATDTDTHNLNPVGEDEIQFVNLAVIPSPAAIKRFSFRIKTTNLHDLQPQLQQPVIVPDHLTLQATLIDRFLNVFREHVGQNPIYYVDQELEACIGCMQTEADVKLQKMCVDNNMDVPPNMEAAHLHPFEDMEEQTQARTCQNCNCRVLWCCNCIGRWWATRAKDPSKWLEARGTCPLCRAVFCLLDVCPVQRR